MTSDEWFADDDLLLAELRSALREAGPVPDDVVDAAKALYTMRTLDDELALLSYDSLADPELAATFRAEAMSVRSLVFGIGETTLDIDVLADTLVGQLSPAVPGRIVVETRHHPPRSTDVDETGMFSVPAPPTGDVRFRVEPTDGDAFVTEWTRF